MKISKGKLKSLESVSNQEGVITAAAMDQRGSLQKSIAKARGVDEKQIPRKDMEDFKIEVVKALTPHASAFLLDPEFGLPASKHLRPGCGLLLAYERTGYDDTMPGRVPALLEGWNVQKLKENGANCVKLLLYYTKFEDAKINQIKKDFIKKVGAECTQQDIAFFLEPVGYDVKGGDAKDVEYAKLKPGIVLDYTQEFSKPEYGVDVLKVEVPVNLKYTEGAKSYGGQKAYDWKEAIKHYRESAQASRVPFIYLSAGVSNAEFLENLEAAAEAQTGFAGVLCGRATWANGVPIFAKGGASALAEWLKGEGLTNIGALNKLLKTTAKPWHAKYGGLSQVTA